MYSVEQHWGLAEIVYNYNDGFTGNYREWMEIPFILAEKIDILNLDSIRMELLEEALYGLVQLDKDMEERIFDKLRSRGLLPAKKDLNPEQSQSQLELF